jgi:hypothetical protein
MDGSRRRGGRLAIGVAAALGLAGCGRPAVVAVSPVVPCSNPSDSVPLIDTVRVGLLDDRLPDPAARLLEAAARVPFIGLDCRGRPTAGFATGWERDDTGRRWTFTLRSDSPIEAIGLRDRWLAAGRWPWEAIQEVTVLGPTRIEVRLAEPRSDLPLEFAGWGFAVAGAHGRPIQMVALPRGTDLRNHLDDGPGVRIDLFVTRDPVVIEYARTRSAWTVTPLPWDRVYWLVTPRREGDPDLAAPDLGAASQLLQAVRAEARLPVSRAEARQCEQRTERGPGVARPEVGYPAGDPVARDLAERMVALGIPAGHPGLRTAALDPGRLAAALERLGLAAVIVVDPIDAPLGCEGTGGLARAGSWHPLIETRAHLVARRGVGPLGWDSTGMLPRSPLARP